MTCPRCHGVTRVVDSREARESVRRRRACRACGHRFTSHEVAAEHVAADRERVAAALRQLAVTLDATAELLRQTSDLLTTPEPRGPERRGRPEKTGADEFERCAPCGALVRRGQMAEHQCVVGALDGIPRLLKRLVKVPHG